jgi:hypothetical protein
VGEWSCVREEKTVVKEAREEGEDKERKEVGVV